LVHPNKDFVIYSHSSYSTSFFVLLNTKEDILKMGVINGLCRWSLFSYYGSQWCLCLCL